ncbi:helix-turn-helix domain-containing protein [Streptomyces sp. NEAU-H3]|uniref:helix-turn-helix domain-containing protein n=1 Tax=Streptomyces sp. NEAU-H3 TaxID=2720636 RepID=UPI00143C32AE|nr:helix-turn-helix domain-containing protein [Streptomyces sp. NEAU-H3]NJA56717.1 helix-turn-helix domain-containing protein [Streptomyces sp. NEAU-H3]
MGASLAPIRVPAREQWLPHTTGRIAPDPRSWMQSVHWVVSSGLYTPTRKHGPKAMNHTTLVIAQEISALKVCRPSIDYLVRKTGCSERTVQYHLDMLREAGLLAYVSKGTRSAGRVRSASVYERIIPTAFDTALGIRTKLRDETRPAYTRVPTGASPEHRKALGKLVRKAARRVRRPRPKAPVLGVQRCTPMGVGTSASSTAGDLGFPPESKLASGDASHPTPKKTQQQPGLRRPKKRRKLNKTGRRFQLARELTQQIPWLSRCELPRVAWVIRDVADAGWTADEIHGWLHFTGVSSDIKRPVGQLAHQLRLAVVAAPTPAARQTFVDMWRDSRRAEQQRHAAYENGLTATEVTQTAAAAMAHIRDTLARQAAALDETTAYDLDVPEHTATDTPPVATADDVRDALQDPTLILAALGFAEEAEVRRVYGDRVVDYALRQANRAAYAPAF